MRLGNVKAAAAFADGVVRVDVELDGAVGRRL